MKTCLLVLALLLGAGRAFAQLSPADEAAVRRTVARITTNFQNHHFADMAAYTTPDVSWVNIVGMWWRGLQLLVGAGAVECRFFTTSQGARGRSFASISNLLAP